MNTKLENLTFEGLREIKYFHACVLKSGLQLLKNGIKPNSDWTVTGTLARISDITGTPYKRSEVNKALLDISAWVKAKQKHRN